MNTLNIATRQRTILNEYMQVKQATKALTPGGRYKPDPLNWFQGVCLENGSHWIQLIGPNEGFCFTPDSVIDGYPARRIL